MVRSLILEAKDVCRAIISVGGVEREYILIPMQKQTQNILYISEKHHPITTIRQAYSQWEIKIQNNLKTIMEMNGNQGLKVQ